jgi:hypothetical protein
MWRQLEGIYHQEADCTIEKEKYIEVSMKDGAIHKGALGIVFPEGFFLRQKSREIYLKFSEIHTIEEI